MATNKYLLAHYSGYHAHTDTKPVTHPPFLFFHMTFFMRLAFLLRKSLRLRWQKSF